MKSVVALRRLKPVTYGVMHLVVAMGVAFAITGEWAAALAIGLIEPIVQTFFYGVHEKVWDVYTTPAAEASSSAA